MIRVSDMGQRRFSFSIEFPISLNLNYLCPSISPNHRPRSTVGEESPDSKGQPTGEQPAPRSSAGAR